jgi:ubiquinone/menaquinone biosynthesis C-methylase UbiE
MTGLKSNTEWKQWGKDDPLWGVASWVNKQKDAVSPWNDEDFYALGESDWGDFLRQWQQYGLQTEHCLEVGCGAGRITKQMALYFDRVDAVDISPDMVAYARARTTSQNIHFWVTDGLHLPQADDSAKAIFSTHVLQHLDTEGIGLDLFREFFRVLDAGGTIMVHLPLYDWPSNFRKMIIPLELLRNLEQKVSDAKAWIQRRRGMKMMRMTSYSTRSLYSILARVGFSNIEFRTFPTTSNGDLHSFVIARK